MSDATLDISVEHHLASKSVQAAQATVAIDNARLRAALLAMRGWVNHWDEDRALNLCPTKTSLQTAREAIDDILGAALTSAE